MSGMKSKNWMSSGLRGDSLVGCRLRQGDAARGDERRRGPDPVYGELLGCLGVGWGRLNA